MPDGGGKKGMGIHSGKILASSNDDYFNFPWTGREIAPKVAQEKLQFNTWKKNYISGLS